ncbi:major facilitator superfamily domain-containing protein [Talaromyces proteolyticus]|uniref:Major facilitator superfamily domain-containing protein n=1 Tax=Talaromyces proteolyticus TaxID=1131652 RepID=A0AAD4Q3C9_9EURO|nr:major facilitator superfamily domain-containing protein [Talaromyces proteolyticus]KAH8704919.1 major facilitator superfamily domain-containing protein [Talaromyces proteolyticus]
MSMEDPEFSGQTSDGLTRLPPVATEETPLLQDGPEPQPQAEDTDGTPIAKQPTTTELIVVLCSIWIGVFLAALDGTVVATLSAPISNSFNSLSLLSWIANSYLISNAAFQPLSGKLTDIYSRRTGLIFSNIFFAIGNLICGLASEAWMMVAGRVVAGIGGGGLLIIATFVTSDLVPLRHRGVWQGIGNICYGSGMGLGGIFGGLVNDSLGWRWAFLIQVPFVVLSGIVVTFTVKIPAKETDRSRIKRVDFLGAFTLIVFLVLLLTGLNAGGNQVPWNHPVVLTTLPLSAVFFVIFIYIEDKVASEPIIPVRLLLDRTVGSACLTNWFATMTVFGTIYYLPIFFQVQGHSATAAGVRLVPQAVGTAVGSLASGVIMKGTGRYKLLSNIVMTLMIVSSAAICTFQLNSPEWLPFVCLFGLGISYGAILTVALVALISAVDHHYHSVVTSASYAFRSTGSTIGITIASAVFQNVLKRQLWSRFGDREGADELIPRLRDNLEEIWNVPSDWLPGVLQAYEVSLRAIFATLLGLTVLAALSNLLIRQNTLYTMSTMSRFILDRIHSGMAIALKKAYLTESTALKGLHVRETAMENDSFSDSSDDSGAFEKPGPSIIQENADISHIPARRKRVLLSTESAFAANFLPPLIQSSDVELRLITDEEPSAILTGASKVPHYMDSVDSHTFDNRTGSRKWLRIKAAELSEWADLLIVAPIDVGTMGSILYGLTNTLTLSLLRGWDLTKPVILVPGMTISEWKNPLTQRQLEALARDWPWIHNIPPLLWKLTGSEELRQLPWEGKDLFGSLLCKTLGLQHVSAKNDTASSKPVPLSGKLDTRESGSLAIPKLAQQTAKKLDELRNGRPKSLPLELWLNIFEDHLGDWEIAKAVGIPTRLSVPKEWQPHILKMSAPASLEYTILRGSFAAITSKIKELTPYTPMPNLACHLILKFSRTDILTYLLEKHPSLYTTTTRFTNLPYLASAIYGNPTVMTWWRDSSDSSTKAYGADAMDGASRAGYINVLDWWLSSGLPLRYTERALESASAEGRVEVLEWWKQASTAAPGFNPIPLKVGKSVLLAAQSGQTDSLAWWDASGIPYTHSESVARIASTHGHLHVLQLWQKLKGPKMIFDNQVLVGATKNGHDEILEWWRTSGLRVEFKTCDIEEALEDADPASGAEQRVRQWWSRNGLNLGVGTSEWMKVKVLT